MKTLLRGAVALLLAGVLAFLFIVIYDAVTAPRVEETVYPNPVVTITMESGEVMQIELYPDMAPNTVANFIFLINSRFYDGLDFYRVIPGAFVQAGSPTGDRTGAASYTIAGEFAANGYKWNTLSHGRGVISMCRSDDYNSASCQFFILQGDYPEYDCFYAAFGQLIGEASYDLLDKIASSAVDSYSTPLHRWVMKTVRVDTFGAEYEHIEYVSPDEETEEENP